MSGVGAHREVSFLVRSSSAAMLSSELVRCLGCTKEKKTTQKTNQAQKTFGKMTDERFLQFSSLNHNILKGDLLCQLPCLYSFGYIKVALHDQNNPYLSDTWCSISSASVRNKLL